MTGFSGIRTSVLLTRVERALHSATTPSVLCTVVTRLKLETKAAHCWVMTVIAVYVRFTPGREFFTDLVSSILPRGNSQPRLVGVPMDDDDDYDDNGAR